MADMSNEAWICWADLRAAPDPESYLTLLLVDVDVSCIWARADGTRHHVVQLEDRADFRLSSVNQQPELCFSESVSDLLQDEVQVDALLPVDVGVTEAGQLLGVSPVNLHLHLKHSHTLHQNQLRVNLSAGVQEPGDFLSHQRDVRRSAETQRTSCFYSDNIQTKLNMQPLCVQDVLNMTTIPPASRRLV